MQAARTRFLAAVLMLVSAGADLDLRDKKNRTVFELGNQQVMQAIDKGKRELRRRYVHALSMHLSVCSAYPELIAVISNYLVE